MRARKMAAGAAMLALAATTLAAVGASPAQAAHGGFHVIGTQLVDANGNPFTPRGTHLPHVFFPQQFPMFVNASGLGANAARVVLGAGHRWGPSLDLENVISECKRVRMICELSPYDATGFGEDPGAVSMIEVVRDYWAHPAVMDAVQGEEAYVLINIANAPRGSNNAALWVGETIQAINLMRDLGYTHTLVVDGPDWGQDWQFVMRDNAPQVAASDPLNNLMFSVHMSSAFGAPQSVVNYLNAFQQMDLPLAIGDFSPTSAHPTIKVEAQARGTGWTACCWSGNPTGRLSNLQVRNFDPDDITTWGKEIFLDTNGIQQTAVRATVFPGCDPLAAQPGPPGQPRASDVTETSVYLDWGPACGDLGSYLVVHIVGTFEVLLASTAGDPPPNRVTVTGLVPGTTYQLAVRAVDAAGQVGDRSPVVEVTTLPTRCTVTYGTDSWPGGFIADVTIEHDLSQTISGWTVQYEYRPGRAVVPPGWSATVSQDGTTVTAVNASWNGNLPPLFRTSFGYQGTDSSTLPFLPTNATLNGLLCTVEPAPPGNWP